jgi:hypothetical protein
VNLNLNAVGMNRGCAYSQLRSLAKIANLWINQRAAVLHISHLEAPGVNLNHFRILGLEEVGRFNVYRSVVLANPDLRQPDWVIIWRKKLSGIAPQEWRQREPKW